MTFSSFKRLVLFALLLALIGIAVLINLDNMTASTVDTVVTAENAVITLVYICCWTAYAFFNKDKKLCIAASVWSAVTLVSAICGILNVLLNGALEASGFFGFVLVISLVPFYGIYSVIRSGVAGAAIIAVIALSWLILNILNIKRSYK